MSERGAPLRLVALDMDGVLVESISSWSAVHRALGTDNREGIRAFLNGEIDDREFILSDVRLWKEARPSFGSAEMRSILRDVPRTTGLLPAVGALRKAGAKCVVVTGGLRTLADMLAAEARLDGVHANSVVFGADGRLKDDAVVKVPLRDKRSVLARVQKELGVTPAETASVGDSRFDVGLFQGSRVSVALNPIDDEAAEAATHIIKTHDLRDAVRPILEGMRAER